MFLNPIDSDAFAEGAVGGGGAGRGRHECTALCCVVIYAKHEALFFLRCALDDGIRT